LQPYTECVLRMQAYGQKAPACTEYIAGWYKFRTRFVDFTGAYVQHCHILAHEDRGMMQLLEVVSDQSGYSHD
jgi:FtsP/CotA-like multicopper oxidase with cupredoxin domain